MFAHIASRLRSLSAKNRQPLRRDRGRKGPKAFRPQCEALEDRTLLTAGALDINFGDNGQVITPFQGPVTAASAGADTVVVQPDGKILVAGGAAIGPYGSSLMVARYNINGTLDTTFGTGGEVFIPDISNDCIGLSLMGSQIVVVASDFSVARLNADGSLDTTFGNDGITPGGYGQCNAVAVDGTQILLAGTIYNGGATGYDFIVERVNNDGTQDATFGNGGLVTIAFDSINPPVPTPLSPNPSTFDGALGIAAVGTQIVVAGSSNNGGIGGDLAAEAMLNADGSLDSSFGTGGLNVVNVGFDPEAALVGPQVVFASAASQGVRASRLNSDGTLDTTFGDAGLATLDFGVGVVPYTLAFSGSQIVVVGVSNQQTPLGSQLDFAAGRLNANGSVDTSFGSGGTVLLDFGTHDNFVSGVAVSGGKTILAGSTASIFTEGTGAIAVAQLTSSGSLDTTFGTGGEVTTYVLNPTPTFLISVSDVAIQSDGKILVAGQIIEDPANGWLLTVIRYNSDGSLDTSFGTDGQDILNLGGNGISNCKLLVSGTQIFVAFDYSDNSGNDFAVAKLNGDGSLDTSFGTGGEVFVSSNYTFTSAVMDGSQMVLAGSLQASIQLTRLNADGSLDTTFGTGGTQILNFALDNIGNPALAVAGGKIVFGVVGGIYGDPPLLVVGRLNTDGSLDSTFGTGGEVTESYTYAQSGASIAVAGTQILVTAGDTLARLNSDGSLDSTFGSGGMVDVSFGGSNEDVVQVKWTGSQILVLGLTGQVNWDFGLARFNADGSLDTSFGSGGIVTTDFYGDNFPTGIAIQSDTKIVIAGITQTPGDLFTNSLAVARYMGDDTIETPAMYLSPAAMPSWTTHLSGYSETITANRGTGPYTFALTSGELPTGLTLNASTGLISGSPTVLGTSVFTITATDSLGATASRSYTITIVPSTLDPLGITAPQTVVEGSKFTITVASYDEFGNVLTDYRGTVYFTSSDSLATLPSRYKYTAADEGSHTFTVTLLTPGEQILTVNDTSDFSFIGQVEITVLPLVTGAQPVSYWDDPHNKNQITAADLRALASLPLVDNNGHSFHPNSVSQLQNWLAKAVAPPNSSNNNPGYQLSAQLAAMDLNLLADDVETTDWAFASGLLPFSGTPGLNGLSDDGFIKVGNLMNAAESALSNHSPHGAYETALTTTLQSANRDASLLPTTLTISGFPTTTTAGQFQNFTVTIRDGFGNISTTYQGTIQFSSSDPHANLSNFIYTFTPADQGVHTFIGSLNTAGVQSLTAHDQANPAVIGSETGITVQPATANFFLLTGFSAPVTAGQSGSLTVTVVDSFGNVVPNYRGTIKFSSSDSQASLPPNYTFTAKDNGSHTFNLTFRTAGTQSLLVSDTADPRIAARLSDIAVTPGAAKVFLVSGFPSATQSGVAQSFSVTALDAFGNVATGFTGKVRFTSSDHHAVLPADYTFSSSDGGMQTFSATLLTPGTQWLKATVIGGPPITGIESGIIVSM